MDVSAAASAGEPGDDDADAAAVGAKELGGDDALRCSIFLLVVSRNKVEKTEFTTSYCCGLLVVVASFFLRPDGAPEKTTEFQKTSFQEGDEDGSRLPEEDSSSSSSCS